MPIGITTTITISITMAPMAVEEDPSCDWKILTNCKRWSIKWQPKMKPNSWKAHERPIATKVVAVVLPMPREVVDLGPSMGMRGLLEDRERLPPTRVRQMRVRHVRHT